MLFQSKLFAVSSKVHFFGVFGDFLLRLFRVYDGLFLVVGSSSCLLFGSDHLVNGFDADVSSCLGGSYF